MNSQDRFTPLFLNTCRLEIGKAWNQSHPAASTLLRSFLFVGHRKLEANPGVYRKVYGLVCALSNNLTMTIAVPLTRPARWYCFFMPAKTPNTHCRSLGSTFVCVVLGTKVFIHSVSTRGKNPLGSLTSAKIPWLLFWSTAFSTYPYRTSILCLLTATFYLFLHAYLFRLTFPRSRSPKV